MTINRLLTSLLLCSVVSLGPARATAATLGFVDNNATQTIEVSWSGFVGFFEGVPNVFAVNGTGFSATGPASTTVPQGPGALTFEALLLSDGSMSDGSRTIYLVEDLSLGQISHILTFSWVGLGFNGGGRNFRFTGSFTTDDESGALGSLGPLTGLEPNVFLEGTLATFSLPNLTGTIGSEADPSVGASPVPEPASLLLIGGALVGTAAARRRRPR